MSDLSVSRDLLLDSFDRIRELVGEVTNRLGPDVATYRPDPEANTIAWLLWHLTRVQDDHVSGLAGTEQIWPKWRDQFDLPFEPFATGYGQSAEEVGQVQVDPDLLAEYHSEVHAATVQYVEELTADELGRVVDEDWDPPVTVAIRLVSVIGDCLQHLGQALYLRGLASRR